MNRLVFFNLFGKLSQLSSLLCPLVMMEVSRTRLERLSLFPLYKWGVFISACVLLSASNWCVDA